MGNGMIVVKNAAGVEVEVGPNVNLFCADLRGADLRGVNLRHAHLQGAILSGADLTCADLHFADLTGADLTGAILRDASLCFTQLRRANLNNADLSHADLRHAILRNALLSGANLLDSKLDGSNLRGADLQGAVLDGAVLNFNLWDENTKWPAGFKPPASQGEESKEEDEEHPEAFSDPMTEHEIDQCKAYVRKNIKDGHWALAELHAEAVSRDTVLKYDAEVYELIGQKAKQIRELIKEISSLSVQ